MTGSSETEDSVNVVFSEGNGVGEGEETGNVVWAGPGRKQLDGTEDTCWEEQELGSGGQGLRCHTRRLAEGSPCRVSAGEGQQSGTSFGPTGQNPSLGPIGLLAQRKAFTHHHPLHPRRPFRVGRRGDKGGAGPQLPQGCPPTEALGVPASCGPCTGTEL